MENEILKQIEIIAKELSPYEKKGLDTSSLKIFIKNLKEFLKLNTSNVTFDDFNAISKLNDSHILFTDNHSFEEKLALIRSFLEDEKVFPKINDVIEFANDRLDLDFKNQKASRDITINRIIGRIRKKPELKEKLKLAVLSIRNEIVHSSSPKKTNNEIISAETFSQWADIIKNI